MKEGKGADKRKKMKKNVEKCVRACIYAKKSVTLQRNLKILIYDTRQIRER